MEISLWTIVAGAYLLGVFATFIPVCIEIRRERTGSILLALLVSLFWPIWLGYYLIEWLRGRVA